ncbi:MAG: hypothetical protein AB7P24_15430 [Nitrospira sp.]
MINTWYIAAIVLGAAAAFCTYYGSIVEGKRSSEEQTSRIETQLQSLGTQIQDLRQTADSPTQSAKVEEMDKRYQALAEDFFRSVPLRSAQEDARTAKQRVEEVQKTQEVEAYFRVVKHEAEKLAIAYNHSAGRTVLELQSNGVPENLFRPSQDHPAYMLLKFDGPKYWGIRIVSYPDRTLSLQFVRLLSTDGSPDYQKMQLTDDSINLILLKNQFGVSLNQSLSEAVRANVTDGISLERQPLDKFESVAAELTRRVIEYELLPAQKSK